ncbi:MAG: phage major capsid protein, P2 family [Candidatus Jettenia sp.]|nr:MAG: phage major capsid protein, P2 family [Candidatus Jettenia sp.]
MRAKKLKNMFSRTNYSIQRMKLDIIMIGWHGQTLSLYVLNRDRVCPHMHQAKIGKRQRIT